MRAVTSIICVLACTAACSESPDAPATLSRPAAGAAALAASSSAGVTAIDLGTLGGTTSDALAINALGHVVGYSLRTDNVQVGALWDGGWHPLDQPAGATSAYAHGVNSGDVVVGIATISGASQAVEWTPSGAGTWTVTTLPGLSGYVQVRSDAYAINASGDVIGEEAVAGGSTYAVLWHQGTPCKLSSPSGPDPSTMTPRGINDNGWIAGNANNINGGSAVLFVPSSSATPCVGQLIVLPRDPTASGSHFAVGVNLGGSCTGWAVAGQTNHALRWSLRSGVTSPTGTQDFAVSVLPGGTGGSGEGGITDDGTIAGVYYPRGGLYTFYGAMWSPSNAFTTLSPIAGYKNAEALGVATVAGAHWAVGVSKSGPQPAHATLWKMP